MRTVRRYLALSLFAGALFASNALAGDPKDAAKAAEKEATSAATSALGAIGQKAEATAAAAADAASKVAAAFQGPVLITDIGQGNNAALIEQLMKRSGAVQYKLDALAKADALADAKTLIIGVGASTKGLGAAGLDADQEMTRAKALIDAAKAAKVPIVGVHIGGEPRRGELSDKFNELVFKASDAFIAWKGGDADGFFTKLAEENKDTKLVVVEKKPEVGAALATLFGAGSAGNAAKPSADQPPATPAPAK